MVKKGSERDLIRTDKPMLGAKNSLVETRK